MSAERTADLSARIGEPLGETPWMRTSQQNINRFGELTGDTQGSHTDPYRAAHTPFGGTIVHGAYLLSLAITFAGQLLPAEPPQLPPPGQVAQPPDLPSPALAVQAVS